MGLPASMLVAVSLFTVLPVPGSVHRRLDRAEALRAVVWLPLIGAVLGAGAAAVLVLVDALASGPPGRLLAASLAILVLAALTGGMHLDGLADTVDGLGSRRPAGEAMEVMSRSDLGPLGAAALVLLLLVQVSALAAVPSGVEAAGGLVVAAVTSRTAVILAAGPSTPSARPGGFGSLVSGGVHRRTQAAVLASVLLGVGLVVTLLDDVSGAARALGALAVGLLVADQARRTAQHRLGGITGDVFGALVEVTTTTVLVVFALTG